MLFRKTRKTRDLLGSPVHVWRFGQVVVEVGSMLTIAKVSGGTPRRQYPLNSKILKGIGTVRFYRNPQRP